MNNDRPARRAAQSAFSPPLARPRPGPGTLPGVKAFLTGMTRSIIFYVGFLLIVILFTEEFRQILKWARGALRQYPHLKCIAYPLAALLAVLAALLIAHSLLTLFGLKYAYD